MNGPAGLLLQKRIQHRLEFVLHPCGLEDSNRLVRAFVKDGVAQHDPDLRRKLTPDFLHHRVVGAASLARWIEELHECDRRIGGTETRGIVPDQKRFVHGWRCGGGGLCFGRAATIQDYGSACEGCEPKCGGPDQKGAAVHGRCPFGKRRLTRIAAKAATER